MNDEIQSWDDVSQFNEQLLRGIYAYGFETPSPIQKRAIKPMLTGKDLLAQAQSGTGKTAAFCLPSLAMCNLKSETTQIIILSPTRELSDQIYNVIVSLSSFMKDPPIHIQLCIGGTKVNDDLKAIQEKVPHIVVGCPGRIYDLICRGAIKSQNVSTIVLDEADDMLSTGFKDQVYQIFEKLPNTIQVCLFSATLPKEVLHIINHFMRDPTRILVNSDMLTLEGISQYYVNVQDDAQKADVLRDMYNVLASSQCIVYCNSNARVIELANSLREENYAVGHICSDMTGKERQRAFEEFRKGSTHILISSNLTSRGIDVQQVSNVINFDFPKNCETYLHRIGRSGRWGRKGTGINFITKHDLKYKNQVESYYSTQIAELPTLDALQK